MSGMPKGKRLDEARVLHLGCGNSRLGEELYDDGVTQITNLDYSSEVIADLAERHEWESDERRCRKAREWVPRGARGR